jgi:hypothetical protein
VREIIQTKQKIPKNSLRHGRGPLSSVYLIIVKVLEDLKGCFISSSSLLNAGGGRGRGRRGEGGKAFSLDGF